MKLDYDFYQGLQFSTDGKRIAIRLRRDFILAPLSKTDYFDSSE